MAPRARFPDIKSGSQHKSMKNWVREGRFLRASSKAPGISTQGFDNTILLETGHIIGCLLSWDKRRPLPGEAINERVDRFVCL